MNMTAVYPGSFDPVTYGHIDIIERASRICNKLVIGVLNNSKKTPLFSAEERVKMLQEVVKDIPNVEVKSFSGLTVDFARENDATVMIRGLRAVTDFEYELQISQTNRSIASDIDTIFFTTNLKYSYVSSSITKELAMYGADISNFVPPYVLEKVREKFKEKEN